MLGLILLYFIGNAFYKLAETHKKSKWGFAILGIGAYYAGAFISGIFLGIFYELFWDGDLDSVNDILLSFLALPFGILSCWGLYKILESRWEKQPPVTEPDILDSDLMR